MSIIKNIILFIKNIFNKNYLNKKIESPKQLLTKEKKKKFISDIKAKQSNTNEKIETLICEGDGLGIQKKINY